MSTYGNDPNYGGVDPTWQDSSNNPRGDAPRSYDRPYGSDVPADGTLLLHPSHKPSFAWLVVVKGARPGQIFAIKEQGMRIGRGGNCDIALAQDQAVSTEHAKVYKENDSYVIHDLASANGTMVNGAKVYHQAIQENDQITIGQTVLIFKQIKEEQING